MTPAEAQVLLSMCAAFDNRKPDPDAAKAWAVALDGLQFDDCRLAIIAHFRTSTEWLMPAKVRAEVKRIRNQRIRDFGVLPDPPSHIDGGADAYSTWLADTLRRIADGEHVEAALPAPNREHIRRMAALVQGQIATVEDA